MGMGDEQSMDIQMPAEPTKKRGRICEILLWAELIPKQGLSRSDNPIFAPIFYSMSFVLF